MANIFFISDTHFGHSNILGFSNQFGAILRPGFSCIEEHDAYIYDKWNSVVKSGDKVYHLGDVALKTKKLDFLGGLRGNKVLYRGNHDKCSLTEYAKYFQDVRGVDYRSEYGFALSHIPIHPNHLRHNLMNLHGHLHEKVVTCYDFDREVTDYRYFNVSCERLSYTPVELGELKEMIRARTD